MCNVITRVIHGPLVHFRTTSIFPVLMDTVHRQMAGFSRVSSVNRVQHSIRIRVSVMIKVRFSFRGAKVQESRSSGFCTWMNPSQLPSQCKTAEYNAKSQIPLRYLVRSWSATTFEPASNQLA